MAPKSPWKQTTLNINAQKAAAAVSDAASPAINYAEVQAEEIEALQAIFMEDYEEIAVKSAWSKTTDRSFTLKLRPYSLDLAKPEDFVVLSGKITATYPKSVPLLEIQGLESFHERTQKRIRNIIELRPKQLLGDVMIHTIAMEVQDALEDAVTARAQGALPSLEEERATAETFALNLAREAEEAEARRLQQVQEEEERVLEQMVHQEINRRDKRRSLKPDADMLSLNHDMDVSETIIFDQSAKVKVQSETISFREVTITSSLSTGPTRTYLGKPKTLEPNVPLVAIVRRKVEKDRKDIIELEAVLDAVHRLHHTSLVNILTYRVERINNWNSTLTICREYADRGSLHDLLSLSDLHVSKCRQFTTQLLEGLEYLHQNGMPHGGVSTKSIYLSSTPTLCPKLADFGYASIIGIKDDAFHVKWRAPEMDTSLSGRRQADIWHLGVVFLQMALGLSVTSQYSSPSALISRLRLSDAFEDLVSKFFADTKKRPSCFDLLPTEFLRTDSPVLSEDASIKRHHARKSSSGIASPLHRRSRHNSSSIHDALSFSRYVKDFTELGRLGKGGFGEVVQARNKLDGGVYAVKKIRQAPQLLDKVLSEVMLLNKLNHPYVVRYFSTWVEEDYSTSIQEEAVSTTEEETVSDSESRMDFGYQSTGGLDFVSSSGYAGIEFGDEDSEEDTGPEPEEDDFDPFDRGTDGTADRPAHGAVANESMGTSQANSLGLKRTQSDSRRSTLYIQMELCDRRSLRDLIRKGMDEDEAWRYMRQITEGLAHIHGHGIIHRDLKPENIFIDATLNPKIGDFGLATTGRYTDLQAGSQSKGSPNDTMTRSVGTALYTAPELLSTSRSAYNEKVDIYSLGIMFFEMCHTFRTGMERVNELQALRRRDHELPSAFQAQANGEKAAQGKLINLLISHKPSERPTASELLRSDMLPLRIEDGAIRQALSGLSDPKSPYHQQLMSALFAHDTASAQRIKARAWEAKAHGNAEDVARTRLRGIAHESLQTVFRRHGAEEARRDSIFPRSGIYTNPNVVQLLDASGNLLQLPYDLTLPHAQQLARQGSNLRCSFAFGWAYRDTFNGGPPRANEEADFDIVNVGRDDDLALDDAEAIKVMDEITSELPGFATLQGICYQVNHSSLLDAILDFCRVPAKQQHAVKETLSKLGVHQWTWAKLRPELRDLGLSDTTLDDLYQFNWRDSVFDKGVGRLRDLFVGLEYPLKARVDDALHHLARVFATVQNFGMQRQLYITPLSCVNAKLYNGILIQCLLEKKKSSVVLTAGGRYDALIESFRNADSPRQGAVGLCIGIDGIVGHMSKTLTLRAKSTFLKDSGASHNNQHLPGRCEVLVVASGTERLRDAGIKLISSLWANDISAELAREYATFPEQNYSFIVGMRHETSTTVRVTNQLSDTDEDIPLPQLASHLLQELRDRATRTARQSPPLLRNHSSHQEHDRRTDNVQVLMARHGSKKSNKFGIVQAAQQRWSEKLDQIKNAPILAIETRDEVLNMIQNTRLSDGESWRKAIQGVQLNERQYLKEVQDKLESWRAEWKDGEAGREVCVYNFRTGTCVYYDLGI
ncbi:kinase Gcn2 [Lecanosticta acicola]|uniref:non-specific serine/threonine protein kinase n=1 Tax=Lecanosticta acicola TaxID=111012 RepID=A0AAI8Z5W3_9PEZI|nr:kinase Gcn2 [Lecanosticta acicola]